MRLLRFMRALDPKTKHKPIPRELVPTAILLGFSLLALVLLEIAEAVIKGETRWFDQNILLALRTSDPADPIGPRWVEASVVDLTALGGFAVLTLVTLLAAGYLLARKRWIDTFMLLAATIGGTLISEGLKAVFNRPRPDLVAHVVETTSMSFPSGHAMLSAVTYLTIGALIARTQEDPNLRGYIMGGAILVTVLVGLTRLYLGVHWPTDVLAGWCFGALWALVCWAIAARLGGVEARVTARP